MAPESYSIFRVENDFFLLPLSESNVFLLRVAAILSRTAEALGRISMTKQLTETNISQYRRKIYVSAHTILATFYLVVVGEVCYYLKARCGVFFIPRRY